MYRHAILLIYTVADKEMKLPLQAYRVEFCFWLLKRC